MNAEWAAHLELRLSEFQGSSNEHFSEILLWTPQAPTKGQEAERVESCFHCLMDHR